MTKTEKIDLLRELDPFYKTNSMIFAFSEKKLDQKIAEFQMGEKEEKTAKEKYYENVVPRKPSNKFQELKRQHKQLINKFGKVQFENIELKEEIKVLKKKLKRIGEILNA